MCLFGAVTAGPLIGGAQASFHAWAAVLTLRSLANTIPVAGTVVAICAATASTSALGLTAAVSPPVTRRCTRDCRSSPRSAGP